MTFILVSSLQIFPVFLILLTPYTCTCRFFYKSHFISQKTKNLKSSYQNHRFLKSDWFSSSRKQFRHWKQKFHVQIISYIFKMDAENYCVVSLHLRDDQVGQTGPICNLLIWTNLDVVTNIPVKKLILKNCEPHTLKL